MVRTINNCPVTVEEVRNVNTIYGCDVPNLKGKTANQQQKRVQVEYIEVTYSLWERIGNLTVAYDVMFVNRIPFVFSVLRGVNFTMVEYVSRRLNTILAKSIEKIFQFYTNNGYTIETFLMYMELE